MAIAFCNLATNAQTITSATYPFSVSTDVSEDMSSGTLQIINPNSDDGSSLLTNIGFTFYYAGVGYTQFAASANGYIRLGTTVNGPGTATDYTNTLALANQSPAIAPYWDDLYTGINGKVHYKVVGTSPNRKLIVEWSNMQIPRVAADLSGAGTFQLWLTESRQN